MMDILKRSLAPLPGEAWEEIDSQAKKALKAHLSARSVVDFDGPHGWKKGSINLGKIRFEQTGMIEEVEYGLRQVQPLMEVRAPFSLCIKDMEDMARGLRNPDLEPLLSAARKIAHFEDKVIYRGFEKGNISGILKSSPHQPIKMAGIPESYQKELGLGALTLQTAGIGGPYHLVLGAALYQALLQGDEKGYPLKERVEGILGGGIYWSATLKGGVILSGRGGDFVLTVGQDFSIGYAGHGEGTVQLFITESFTFQVLEPKAAVELIMEQ